MKALLVLLLLLPLGCGRADANRAGMTVVARVNGSEISAPETPGAQALEEVIERELLVQQALQAGLERDPKIAEAIESARRELLARAWIERIAAGTRSTREEVRAFYLENPALFAERRLYRMQELAVWGEPALVESLRARVAGVAELEALAAWLRSRDVRFSVATLTQPAEQVPLARLPRLARMVAGELAVFEAPQGAVVVQLLHAEEAPLGEAEAAPLIERFLSARKRLEVAAAEVKRLRKIASIEYSGDIQARAR